MASWFTADNGALWLIAGLGNPGSRYAWNWHNSGYRALDLLAGRHRIAIDRIRFHGLAGDGKIKDSRCLLLKPTTFMNRSGESIREAAAYYKISLDHCLVLYDDIDIPLGQIRIRENGGPGTHNGMRSVVQSLGSEAFPRIRIGIGPQPEQWDIADYVLSDIPDSVRGTALEMLARACDAVEALLQDGQAAAMNRFNRR